MMLLGLRRASFPNPPSGGGTQSALSGPEERTELRREARLCAAVADD
jgi:hypothetical protein